MVRRIDVTGSDGARLAAWEFADPPKEHAEPVGESAGRAPQAPGSYCCTG